MKNYIKNVILYWGKKKVALGWMVGCLCEALGLSTVDFQPPDENLKRLNIPQMFKKIPKRHNECVHGPRGREQVVGEAGPDHGHPGPVARQHADEVDVRGTALHGRHPPLCLRGGQV